jgi:hypothetical protein
MWCVCVCVCVDYIKALLTVCHSLSRSAAATNAPIFIATYFTRNSKVRSTKHGMCFKNARVRTRDSACDVLQQNFFKPEDHLLLAVQGYVFDISATVSFLRNLRTRRVVLQSLLSRVLYKTLRLDTQNGNSASGFVWA